MLVDGESVLYEFSVEDMELGEEKRMKEGSVSFVLEMPVPSSLVAELAQMEQLVLKIHFLTITHRIDLTLHRKKLFREYEVPRERLVEWGKMVGDKEGCHNIASCKYYWSEGYPLSQRIVLTYFRLYPKLVKQRRG